MTKNDKDKLCKRCGNKMSRLRIETDLCYLCEKECVKICALGFGKILEIVTNVCKDLETKKVEVQNDKRQQR